MTSIFEALKHFLKPISRIALALVPAIGILLETISDPAGALNQLLVTMIDYVAIYWPETPEQLKLSNLVMGQLEPGTSVGEAIIIDIFQTAFLMLSVVVVIKLYKLIPFKAT